MTRTWIAWKALGITLCALAPPQGSVTSSPQRLQGNAVTLCPAKDNTLIETAPTAATKSNATGPLFAGRVSFQGGGTRRRGVMAFDIAGSIPAGSTIDAVTLRLFMSASNAGARNVGLRLLTSDWGEGTSFWNGGQGAPSTSGDATWFHTFFPSSRWTTAGGDIAGGPARANTAVGGIGFYSWSSSGTVIDVQNWLDDPSTSFGWIILGDESSSGTAKRFESRESTNAARRPQLTIDYTPHAPTCTLSQPSPIMATVGVPVSFTVTGQDPDAADTVTLTATGVPIGASLTPPSPAQGNPVVVTFDWTPTNADIGTSLVTFTVADPGGLQTSCSVTIEVAECYLILGRGAGASPFTAGGQTWATQLVSVAKSYPVTMENLRLFTVASGPRHRKRRMLPLPIAGAAVQILMWNPEVFPTNPAQWSQGLQVTLWSDGSLTSAPFGSKNGMNLTMETLPLNGFTLVRFPFTIEGFGP